MAVEIHIVVFWIMTPAVWYVVTNVSEEYIYPQLFSRSY
jgi:hypothetical protein